MRTPADASSAASSALRRRQPRLSGGDRLSQRAVVGIGRAFRQLRLGDPELRLSSCDRGVGGVDRRSARLLGDRQLRLRLGVASAAPRQRPRRGPRFAPACTARRCPDRWRPAARAASRTVADALRTVWAVSRAARALAINWSCSTRAACAASRAADTAAAGVVDRLLQLETLRFGLRLLGVVERLASFDEGPLGSCHRLPSRRHLGALLVGRSLGGVAGIGVHLLGSSRCRRVEHRVDGAGVVAETDHRLLKLADVGTLRADHQSAIHRQFALEYEHRAGRDLDQHVALLYVSADVPELGHHSRLTRIEADGAGQRDTERLVVGDLARQHDLRRELPALDGDGHQRRGRSPACRRPVGGRLDPGTDPHARRAGQHGGDQHGQRHTSATTPVGQRDVAVPRRHESSH